VFPHQGSGLIQKCLGALRRLRAQRYDLALDPIPESTGGRVALTLCLRPEEIEPGRIALALEFREAFLELEPDAIPVGCLPTVALFRASDPVLYGPLKPVDLAINIAQSTRRLVAQRRQRLWRESIGGNSAPF
jgi:hypothetical protein